MAVQLVLQTKLNLVIKHLMNGAKWKRWVWNPCFFDDGWHINLTELLGARPDHVRVEISSWCFPRELVSFVHPRRVLTRNKSHILFKSKNVFELGGIALEERQRNVPRFITHVHSHRVITLLNLRAILGFFPTFNKVIFNNDADRTKLVCIKFHLNWVVNLSLEYFSCPVVNHQKLPERWFLAISLWTSSFKTSPLFIRLATTTTLLRSTTYTRLQPKTSRSHFTYLKIQASPRSCISYLTPLETNPILWFSIYFVFFLFLLFLLF